MLVLAGAHHMKVPFFFVGNWIAVFFFLGFKLIGIIKATAVFQVVVFIMKKLDFVFWQCRVFQRFCSFGNAEFGKETQVFERSLTLSPQW